MVIIINSLMNDSLQSQLQPIGNYNQLTFFTMLPKQHRLKTFILQNQSTQHSQVVIQPIDISQRQIDLHELLSKHVEHYQFCEFRIYDFLTNQYKNFIDLTNTPCNIPRQFISNGQAVVLIKYKNTLNEERSTIRETFSECEDVKQVSVSSSHKKQRAKQRAIAQVIQIVKRWRQLHLEKRAQKRISLQQAAKIIGLPKKSLDDYYYQLRLGEKYNFDFRTNLYEGIGCLRNFLKDKKPKLKSQQGSEKSRPKSLRIIQLYDEIKRMGMRTMEMDVEQQHDIIDKKSTNEKRNQNKKKNTKNKKNHQLQDMIFEQQQQQPINRLDEQKSPLQYQQQNPNNNNNNNTIIQLQLQNDDENNQIKLENQFYEDFGFMEFNQDPFVSMDGNFKKKKYQNLFDEEELFF